MHSAIAKAGKKGTLAVALQAIADQSKPVTVIVRVEAPKPQKQRVKLQRKPKEQHLRTLQHPKVKPVAKEKTTKEQEAREGEYMVGEADNVFARHTSASHTRCSGKMG